MKHIFFKGLDGKIEFQIDNGILQAKSLEGTGNRLVQADALGKLSATIDVNSLANATGSTGYIWNQNTAAQDANFWIAGDGKFGGNLNLNRSALGLSKLQFTYANTEYGQLSVDTSIGTMTMSSPYQLYFVSNGVTGIRVHTDGNVAIKGGNLGVHTLDVGGSVGNSGYYRAFSLQVGEGSATAPVYSFYNDLNNGWYAPAYDTQAWTTNGVERMKLDDTRLTLNNFLKFTGAINTPTVASGTDGDLTYNTTDKKIKSFNPLSSNWDSQATEEWVHANLRVGRIIYVDKNNPYATDTRTGLSQYSLTKPFFTINAAVNAAVTGDIIYVRPGTYNESVYLNTFTTAGRYYDNTFILDNCTIDGGTNYAFWMNENFGVTIYMINSTIKNTGDALDRDATSAIRFGASDFKLFGNSRATCKVTSVEGHAVYDFSPAGKVYNNVTLSSTNGWCFYTPYGNGQANFTLVTAISTNSGAIKDDFAVVDTCYIKGKTVGLSYHNQGGHKVKNTYIESTEGHAISATNGFSYQPNANYYNCEMVSYNQAIYISTHWNLGYKIVLDNCRMKVTNPAVTEMVRISPADIIHESNAYATVVESWFNVSNCIVNKTMFQAAVRYNDAEYLNESNTQVGEDTVFFGLNVGFGIEDAQANVHIKGDAIFDVQTGILDEDDFVYAKDIATGKVKMVPATGMTTGGGSGSHIEIVFKVGDVGFPGQDDTTFTDSQLIGKAIRVYREGERQYVDSNTGIGFDNATGTITFYPSLNAGEPIIIEVLNTTLSAATPGVFEVNAHSSSKTLTDADFFEAVDASGGARTITLPTAVGRKGKAFEVVKVDSSTNTVTVNTTSSQTINSATSFVLGFQWEGIAIISNGVNWIIRP